MFSKASGKAPTAAATMAKDSKTSLKTAVPSTISADMKIVGSIDSAGDIQIDGPEPCPSPGRQPDRIGPAVGQDPARTRLETRARQQATCHAGWRGQLQ